jgi:HEAT repeat protein
VRTEAIRVQLQLPGERDPAVLTALGDDDPRIAALGLREALKHCPPAAVSRVAELALETEASEEVRCLAASALGQVRQPGALGALLKLADGGRSFLGRRKLPPLTPVVIASIKALAQQRAADRLAVSILATAARSSDPEVREAAQGGS